ncbi:MAG: ATP-binding protein, partial [Gammaproteobacteria bacterium]
LGLSIVARIVELHRGEITVSDSALGGAKFRISLPSREGN